MKVLKVDKLVKSRKKGFFVIPAEAGIQSFKAVKRDLDSGFRRSDAFLREHQSLLLEKAAVLLRVSFSRTAAFS